MEIWFQEEVEEVPDHVKKLCENIFRERGFNKCEVSVEPAVAKGGNYCSVVLRLTARDGNKTFSVIVKKALVQEYFRILFFTPLLFYNENVMYKDFFPILDELQTSAGIPEEERFGNATFFTSADKPSEVIILEDLKEKGYRNLDANTNYNYEDILLTLKEFAKYHALCFVFRIKYEHLYADLKTKLVDLWSTCFNTAAIKSFYETVRHGTSAYFTDEREKQYLSNCILNISELSQSLNKVYMDSKYSIIALGYYWKNKPMYVFENGKPVKIKFLDFQQSRIGSPTSEIHFYILNTADYEGRKKYYREWLDYYYANFEEYLSKFGFSSEKVYPREEFEKGLKLDSKQIFGVSVLCTSILARESELRVQAGQGVSDENPAQQYKDTVFNFMKTWNERGYLE